MPTTGNLLLLRRLITVTLFKLLHAIFGAIQGIYWEINGTARRHREAKLLQNYDRSAHVVDVVMSHKFCELQPITISDFIYTHSGFTSPQYIIDNDHITLMTLTKHNAVFCEPAQKGMHLWKVKYNPFIRLAQMSHARRLIFVPLKIFHMISEKIGDPRGQLVFVYGTTRCGSTMFAQMMEHTNRFVSVLEPNATILAAARYCKYGDTPEVRQLMRDVISWECRPYPTMESPPLGYAIKLSAHSVSALPLIREIFPSSRVLYVYRDTLRVARSLHEISMTAPSLRLGFLLGRLSAEPVKFLIDSMGFDGSDFGLRLTTDLTLGIVYCVIATRKYFEYRDCVGAETIAALRYEDMIARPMRICQAVMEFCRLPVSLVESAVRGLQEDCPDSPLAKFTVGRATESALTPTARASVNSLLKKYGLPVIGEPIILAGSLGHLSAD